MMKHLYAVLPFLLCTSCGSSVDVNVPEAPSGELAAGAPAVPQVSGLCRILPRERALQVEEDSTSVGTVGGWNVAGFNDGPYCTEPYLDERVECEMDAGDVVILRRGDQLLALENTYSGVTSIRIAQQKVICSPLVVE